MNQRNYQVLFDLLDYGGNLAIEAWKMINRLPTSKEIMEKITKLEGISNEKNEGFWEDLLHTKSNYRLLYNLSIIEYLMEEDEEEELLKSPEKDSKGEETEAKKLEAQKKVEVTEQEKLEKEAKEEREGKNNSTKETQMEVLTIYSRFSKNIQIKTI